MEKIESDKEKAEEADDDEAHYDRILSNIGFGKFHIALLLVCGWTNASDAVEVLAISFVLPSAECDLYLDGPKKGWMSAMTFVGMMIGGYIWGAFSDSRGRKPALMLALLVNALSGLVSAFMPVYWLFLPCRLISGLGVGGSIPVVWSYFAEFLPAKGRGSYMSLMATSWLCGNLLVAGLAWIIVPIESIQIQISPILTLTSWRIFVLVAVFPAISAATLLSRFPESPKFCLRKGQRLRAFRILSAIYEREKPTTEERQAFNQSPLFKDLRSTEDEFQLLLPSPSPSRGSFLTRCRRQFDILSAKTSALFRPPHLRNNLVMITIFFSICFGYYGMLMWFPELFALAAKTGMAPCAAVRPANASFHDFAEARDASLEGEISMPTMAAESGNFTSSCYPSTEVFVNSFLTTASAVPGFAFAIAFMDRLGRKGCLIISMITSGLVVFGMWIVQAVRDALILSCLFSCFSNIGFSAFNCMAVELFPTELRATATGFQLGMGRVAAILGNVVFGELLGVNCAVPILLVATLMTSGGFVSLMLPNTTNSLLK